MAHMCRSITLLLLLCLTLILPAVARAQAANINDATAGAAITLPLASSSARDLFSRYKDRLVQVRVLLNSANEQSSLGSAFVVANGGQKGIWLLTNYHVVSSLAINPQKYHIELRPTSEVKINATLVAVDVIHDLAVLRAEPALDAATWPAFTLRDAALEQGEKIFSLGNPLELGFLISEGIYNGLVESRIYDQMLFSGAINAGMSGGPTIDEAGRVVGVNVAVRRDAQLISFLVPVRYARDLLTRAWTAPPRKEWRTEIGKQLLAHQDFVVSKLLSSATINPPTNKATASSFGFASQTLAGRKVPTIDSGLTKCWAGGRDGERPRYQRDKLDCNLQSDLYVRGNLYTGSVGINHVVLRNIDLATPQFLSVGSFMSGIRGKFRYNSGAETTSNECHDEYLRGIKHVYRAAICVKAYRKFEGIYDFNVSATQVDDANERQISSLTLNGLSFENGQILTRKFLEQLE
jgi:serine protease Do